MRFAASRRAAVRPPAALQRAIASRRPSPGRREIPLRGKKIVLDRQVGLCLLCHSGPFPEERFQGDLGPNLAGVGARLSAGQIRLRIVDASRVNPQTIMPPYYRKEGLSRVAPSQPARRC